MRLPGNEAFGRWVNREDHSYGGCDGPRRLASFLVNKSTREGVVVSSSDVIRWRGIATMISGVLFIVGALYGLTPPTDYPGSPVPLGGAPCDYGARRISCLAEERLRTHRAGRLLDGHIGELWGSTGHYSLPCGKRSFGMVGVSGRFIGYVRGVCALRSGNPAS